MKRANNPHHKAPVTVKVRWLLKNREALKRYPNKLVVEIMRDKGLFSKRSYWYDCQGLICSVLRRPMQEQAFETRRAERTGFYNKYRRQR